jgi:SAM-dependent methyltransferase
LISQWLPALDGIVERLDAGMDVADVGCGYGHSTVLMAKAFPCSHFYGFDTHADSIHAARSQAVQAGVASRATFSIERSVEYPNRKYGLICFFDCLHDLGDPVAAMRHAAEALAPDGTVLVVEPYAHDRVEDNIGLVGQLYYAASTTICCAHAIAEGGTMVLGAQAGEARLTDVCRKAGLSHVRRVAETPFNMILEVRR